MSRDLKYFFPVHNLSLPTILKRLEKSEEALNKAAHNGAHLFSTELSANTKNLPKEMQDSFE